MKVSPCITATFGWFATGRLADFRSACSVGGDCLRLGSLGALLVMLAGCAAIKPEAMVPESFELENKHDASVSITVPRATMNKIYGEGHWTSQITANTFADSLTRSSKKSGVFSSVLNTPDGDYLLHVSFVSVQEPAAALDMKVELVTKWILTKQATGEDVFRESISTTYVAKLGRAFAGGTRLRLANEGAGQANIKEGIRRLSALKL